VEPTKKKNNSPVGGKIIKIIVLFVVFFSCVVAILSLPVWRIKRVIIEGNSLTSENIIKQKAAISFDENIFFVNYREVTRRLKQIPQVKNAWVSGRLPSSVMMKIEERSPFAVAVARGQYAVVDDEGIIIDLIKGAEHKSQLIKGMSDLPTVIGLPKTAIVDDKKIKPEIMYAVSSSFKLLGKILEKSKFELELTQSGDMNIFIDDILKVKIGSPDNIDQKLSDLSQILEKIGRDKSKIEYIDVRIQRAPAVRFKT
jgi:cell division protein FtsQ